MDQHRSQHRLPGRIAAVMVGAAAILVLTVGVSVTWMTRAMDDQSRRHSTERVRTALVNVLHGIRANAVDNAKWDDAAEAAAARDAAWLSDNIGTSAVVGGVAQVAVVWGGPFPQNLGWTAAGGAAPRSGVLDPEIIALAERGLAPLPLDFYQGVTFFAWRGGEVVALAAARIEATQGSPPLGLPDAERARLVLGLHLDGPMLRRIGDSVLLDGIEIVRTRPEDRPSLPLMGGDAVPVAHLAWDTNLAGTALLHRMLAPLAALTALAAGLLLVGTALARRSAGHLVRAERRSAEAARTDGLTGLPNRLAFNEALAQPARAGERAVLFLDLNGFKRINDSIGHAAGDQVIAQLAERLAGLAAPGSTLARIGGDEFVFVLTGPDAEARAEGLGRAVEEALSWPFEVMGHRMRLQAAMGHAAQATDGMPAADLVRQADLAMYEAKRGRRAGSVAFGAMIEQADHDAREIEGALRDAIARPGELSIEYQPIVAAGTGRLVRAEALARWTSPRLGRVPPDRFIAVAEQSGLIVELGRRLLALVCDDIEAHTDLDVSVNISPLQLMAPDFLPDVAADLARRGIAPSRIEVELTESVVVDDPPLAARRLRELHEAGFSTALDDFGTGYSSIGYLEQMEFNVVKIDRSFVTGVCASGSRLALVNAMIGLAHALGLGVVCEGVETEEELAMLRELGCDLAQGYHIDRPLPIARLAERWLAPRAPRAAVA